MKGHLRQRLLEMGIIQGAIIKSIRLAPLGDPVGGLVPGSVWTGGGMVAGVCHLPSRRIFPRRCINDVGIEKTAICWFHLTSVVLRELLRSSPGCRLRSDSLRFLGHPAMGFVLLIIGLTLIFGFLAWGREFSAGLLRD